MTYDGPELFRAPIGSDAAQENFRRTVLDGVPADRVAGHTERRFDDDRVRLWGTKESVSGTWEDISPGDFLIFYEDGEYPYAAEVTGTERNEPLGREIWPNHDADEPWVCIIYLDEPVDLGVESAEIHDLAGYDIGYTLGFSPLNEMGLGGIRGKYGSVEAFVRGDHEGRESEPSDADIRQYDDGIDPTVTPSIELGASVLSDLYFPGDGATEILDQIQSALNAGKHVVLTGPPGTGKTEIARAVADTLATQHPDVFSGFQMTTATADWSTFETVGGYMPEEAGDGDLVFEPGQVLRRFKRDGTQRNELLIIDEINRADIDKSFGQLFTLLSGQPVQLPFKRDGREVELLPADRGPADPGAHQYVVPTSWRILATMNTYDKTSLYELSYAFMRRFAFVHVGAPDIRNGAHGAELVGEYADIWGFEPSAEVRRGVGAVWNATNAAETDRKIGPAIVRDILGHVENSVGSTERAITDAVGNYVFPQLEGVPRRERVVSELVRLDAVDSGRLAALGADMLGTDVRSEIE